MARGREKAAVLNAPVEGPWELPEGWRWATVGQIAEVIAGQSPPSSTYNDEGAGLPFFQGKAEFGKVSPTPRKWCSTPSKIAEAGDILMSVRAPVGPTNIASVRCGIGRGLAAIRPFGGVERSWLRYWFILSQQALVDRATGTTFEAITGNVLRSHYIPVPPLETQQRLVARIDELFSELDDGEAALARAREDLEIYRKALLKAAVTGELTADWRAANPCRETGEQLLKRILAERRARWEANPKNKGKRYKEPTAPDTSGLPELPEGWAWAGIEQLIATLRNGLSVKPASSPPGLPILRISAVREMSVSTADVRWLPESVASDGYWVRKGDLLFTRYNGSPDLVGVCGRYRDQQNVLHPDKLMRADPIINDDDLYDFFEMAANTGETRKFIASYTKTSAGQHGVSGDTVKRAPMPLPPENEIRQIMERLSAALTTGIESASALAAIADLNNSLRQSILAAAFKGELVQ